MTPDEPQQQATIQAAQDQGNVLPAIPAVTRGPDPVPLVAIGGAPLARAPDGRLYNPAKGEPPPKDTRPGGKAQSVALLNSPNQAQDNELERRDTRIGGISDIPESWPELPNNASLGVEVSWVQGERLRVVKELPRGGFKVDLTKAKTPAPSMGALSWLETAIRTPTKFAELAAKQGSAGSDEAEFIRKERMAIAEMRAILLEMMPSPKG